MDGEATTAWEGKFLRIRKAGNWEYAERTSTRKGAVAMVAVTPEQEIILIHHHNPPHDKMSIELPGGLIGDSAGIEGEAPLQAASRELLEETGYEASTMQFIATAATSSGMSNELVQLYRVTDMKKIAEGGGVDGENITVLKVPLATAFEWLTDRSANGWPAEDGKRIPCIVDLKIYAALYFASQIK